MTTSLDRAPRRNLAGPRSAAARPAPAAARDRASAGDLGARARSRAGSPQPTAGPARDPASAGSICPTRSASPPASTRTPKRLPGLVALGFGFIEIGTVTPRPQAGNPRPRLFRLPRPAGADQSAWASTARASRRVRARLAAPGPGPGHLGANIGANRDSRRPGRGLRRGPARPLRPGRLHHGQRLVAEHAGPARAAAARAICSELLGALLEARAGLPARPRLKPLLVKIAPDLEPDDERDIAEVALDVGHRRPDRRQYDGRAPRRPGRPRIAHEAGGLSGAPLFAPLDRAARRLYRLTGGRLPLIGVGGIASGADAYAKIRAGAVGGAALHRADLSGAARGRRRACGARRSARRATAIASLSAAVGSDPDPARPGSVETGLAGAVRSGSPPRRAHGRARLSGRGRPRRFGAPQRPPRRLAPAGPPLSRRSAQPGPKAAASSRSPCCVPICHSTYSRWPGIVRQPLIGRERLGAKKFQVAIDAAPVARPRIDNRLTAAAGGG